ncbi:MAG: hypothetical protein J6X53_02975, partial [Abditibacteriota bacterium]|nr:hypothetical protein [Abditibacteriota bacterium]
TIPGQRRKRRAGEQDGQHHEKRGSAEQTFSQAQPCFQVQTFSQIPAPFPFVTLFLSVFLNESALSILIFTI